MAGKGKSQVVVHLLRHAHSVANEKGVLAGQTAGVHLSKSGEKQAIALIEPLKALQVTHLHISPMDRCWETINPFIEATTDIEIAPDPAFIEMNYGEWSGKKLAGLSKKGLWEKIQESPSLVRFPAGESFGEMLSRVVEGIEIIRSQSGVHLIVSHGDVIRVALNHYLGSHLDTFQRLSIAPASLSTLIFSGKSVSISRVNVPLGTSSANAGGESTLGGGSGTK